MDCPATPHYPPQGGQGEDGEGEEEGREGKGRVYLVARALQLIIISPR